MEESNWSTFIVVLVVVVVAIIKNTCMNEAYLFVQNVYTVLEYKPLPGLHTYIDLIQAERMTRKRETLKNSSNCPQAHSHSYKEFHSLRYITYT
jgi:hypothetical protein